MNADDHKYNCQVEEKPCDRWCGGNGCLSEEHSLEMRLMHKAEHAADWQSRAEIAERALSLAEAQIQEARDFIVEQSKGNIGGGEKPIEFLLASYKMMARERTLAQTEIKGHMRVEDELKAGVEKSRLLYLALEGGARATTTRLEEAQVRIAELEKDAARYAWLRDTHSEWGRLFAEPIKWEGGAWVKLGSRWVKGHLDAAIDAAIKDRA
jgi:hypothetical protein